MRLLCVLIILLAQVGMIKAQIFDSYFEEFKSLPEGKILSSGESSELCDEFNSHFGLNVTEGWTHEEPSGNNIRGTYDELKKIMFKIPLDYLSMATFNDMNMLMVYVAPMDKGEELETVDSLEVLVVWNINFYGRAIVLHGSMNKQDFMLLQCGKVSMDFFGTTVTPMPKSVFEVIMGVSGNMPNS